MYQAVTILEFYCPLFEDPRVFELVRAGWSTWYIPSKVTITPAFMLGQCFWNLLALFGVKVEGIPSEDPMVFSATLDRITPYKPTPIRLTEVSAEKNQGRENGVRAGAYNICKLWT